MRKSNRPIQRCSRMWIETKTNDTARFIKSELFDESSERQSPRFKVKTETLGVIARACNIHQIGTLGNCRSLTADQLHCATDCAIIVPRPTVHGSYVALSLSHFIVIPIARKKLGVHFTKVPHRWNPITKSPAHQRRKIANKSES